MRRIVVDMQNALFTDAIAAALRNFDSDFEVFGKRAAAKNGRVVRRCACGRADCRGHKLYAVDV